MPIRITELVTYPVKSLQGISLQSSPVENMGLRYDRRWALVDSAGDVLTARDFPQLLTLQTTINTHGIEVSDPLGSSALIPFKHPASSGVRTVRVNGIAVSGQIVDSSLNRYFSDFLDEFCYLVQVTEPSGRAVLTRHGGLAGDVVAFADECPLLLTNEASLAALNAQLDRVVSMRQFRPNLVVAGADAFVEEGWSFVQTQACDFTVPQTCKRCGIATLDPQSGERHPQQEPLRSLSKLRNVTGELVVFGVHLAPAKQGILKVGDTLSVVE